MRATTFICSPRSSGRRAELLAPRRSSSTASPWPLRYQVLLPPSYDEQTRASAIRSSTRRTDKRSGRRRPIRSASGSSTSRSISSSSSPSWRSSSSSGSTRPRRGWIDLGPVPDPDLRRRPGRAAPRRDHGRPQAAHRRRVRTRAGREDTGLIGSSLGGLFSFYAAWNRPDVFGKAICLSSSFWWANRYMIRAVDARRRRARRSIWTPASR